MKNFTDKLYIILSSRIFFWSVIVFFVIESLWIALSAVYPQAFDENFHFGLIQVYSHHLSPFLSSQPAGADAFGAVARDPSYLYPYLMSFPYRLIALVVHNEAGQIVALRIINIAFFTGGLILFRQLLRRAKLSRPLSNITIFVMALLPVVPQLAGQINYDNLLFLLIAIIGLLTFRLIDELKQKRPSSRTILVILIVCLLTTMVKYAFLPIFLAVVVFAVFYTWQQFRGKLPLFSSRLHKDWKKQKLIIKILLIGGVIIGLGLFAQREGVNFVEYHSLAPDCSKVLNSEQCKAYPVWRVDNEREQNVQAHPDTIYVRNIFSYAGTWIYWMWYRLFFAVNGPISHFHNVAPLPLPAAGAVIILLIGIAVVIKFRSRIFRDNPYLIFLTTAMIFYVAILFANGYAMYLKTNVLELQNGRYLLPVLPMAAAIIGRGASLALRKFNQAKTWLVIATFILFIEGGGIFTFIMRSDASWYWDNPTVIRVNQTAQDVLKPVLVEGDPGPVFWYPFKNF